MGFVLGYRVLGNQRQSNQSLSYQYDLKMFFEGGNIYLEEWYLIVLGFRIKEVTDDVQCVHEGFVGLLYLFYLCTYFKYERSKLFAISRSNASSRFSIGETELGAC